MPGGANCRYIIFFGEQDGLREGLKGLTVQDGIGDESIFAKASQSHMRVSNQLDR